MSLFDRRSVFFFLFLIVVMIQSNLSCAQEQNGDGRELSEVDFEMENDQSKQILQLDSKMRSMQSRFEKDKEVLEIKLQEKLNQIGEGEDSTIRRRELIKGYNQELDILKNKFKEQFQDIQRQKRKMRLGREEVDREEFLQKGPTGPDVIDTVQADEFEERRKKFYESYTDIQPNKPFLNQNGFQQQNLNASRPAQQRSLEKIYQGIQNEPQQKAEHPPKGALFKPMHKTIKSISNDPHRP